MTSAVVVAIVAVLISFLGFCVSVITIRQNNQARRLDNLLQINQFLMRDELSEARQAIREGSVSLSLQEPKVRRVCSSFDFAGNLIKSGVVDADPFIAFWGLSLRLIEEKLRTVADKETGTGIKMSAYYRDFFWLLDEIKKRGPPV